VVPSSGGRTLQRNVHPTHQSSYYVVFAGVIQILDIKILKYIKFITVNLERCNINSIKSIARKPFQAQQLLAAAWIMHTDICADRT
jgi:hypothetical protein